MSVPNHKEPWLRGAEEFRGQRLLPHVIDYHAHEGPSRVFNSMPRTQNVADGFRDVDMKTMATAVDFMAWWLDSHSKDVPKEKKVLAYVGVADIRYPVLFFAAIKAGWMKLAGTMAFMVIPTFSTAATAVWGPSTMPPSGQLVSSIMNQTTVRALYIPPSTVEQWWTCDPDARKKAEGLDFVLFGGGPLAPNVGQKLSELTDLCQMYGSIESGQIQMLVPQPGEWQYLEPNPAEECDMQEVEKDSGLYELVLHQDDKFSGRRTLSHTFPDAKEWRTKDLFTPHPTKPGLWQFHSRTDDLIALGTSAKVFPVPMETALQGDPNIAGALVVGNARPAVVLITEPAQSMSDISKEEFIDKIWPSVVEANAATPTHGKISRSRILLTDPAVGFARTPKGTIARKKSEALYTAAIDSVFRDGMVSDNSSTSAF
ncbi:hypothetical protein BDV38DRAFT_274032 [Aspergillus pseudotamarii]|uniref:AMP-dependent synthetase/ligase domain-containing protein n=1 Tax=Aspergillus pseudotamarii TaxID=132259 RepID=A0A5N6SKB2_ASPPS|nr:uncharacterized protein BDV38DRAFT_274032 [Aspergillus pseudotamarii]KAE8133833.1 hypothetical protein BDV38DRAFT_274032 [Aspergillus pseudotamarii]